MITPSFKLEQNENYLFVNIKAPYAKLNEVDVSVDENDFRFYCKPYYLRLNLPGKILDNLETEHGTYDFDEKTFKFKYEKQIKGENFEGLDLLTKLLTPSNNINAKNSNPINSTGPLIQEISETNDQDEENEDENDWFIEQNIQPNNDDSEDIKSLSNLIKYGFAQTKSNIFSKLSSEYTLIIDLPDPDITPIEERTKLRIETENEKFDPDHYLADYFDDTEMIENHILKFEPSDDEDEKEMNGNYTEKEFDCLKSLTKKTYLLDKNEKFIAFSGMIDILFGYCYNKRINCGEENVESGWNIAKLSSTLSWFDTFKSLEDVLIACFRRSLTYPLYRNWKLSKTVFKDLVRVLKKGRKYVIKVFVKIRESFFDGDCRYILNDLYINDYLVWLQYVSEEKLIKLAECIEKIKITKDMVNLDLNCIELSGKLAMEDPENDGNLDDQHKLTQVINSQENLKEIGIENKLNLLNIQEKSNENIKQKPKIVELN